MRRWVVMMTAHATIESAIDAMKLGAADYLQKPFEIDEFLVVVRRAIDHERLRTQHDYLTIGPNKISDAVARIAVQCQNRERLYSRTRSILQHNLPIMREWVDSFGGFLTFREPQAGALCLMQYHSKTPSYELAERVRINQSVLIVPGAHLGLEGFLRLWLGGKPEFLAEGLRRISIELSRENA